MLIGPEPLGTVAYLGGVPAVPEAFCCAWGQLVQFTAEQFAGTGGYVHWARSTHSFHATARNELVRNFLGDWLLMLDTDMPPPPDLVVRMLRAAEAGGADVLTGLYCHKRPPHGPVLYVKAPEGRRFLTAGDWTRTAPLLRVDGAGAGCLFVRRAVFTRIVTELHEEPFDIAPPLSEDLSFCERLGTLGIPLWCAPSIAVGHLRESAVTPADFDPSEGLLVPYAR
jgi:GT2 family glycosyltransferase